MGGELEGCACHREGPPALFPAARAGTGSSSAPAGVRPQVESGSERIPRGWPQGDASE